ncbi:helix-turn-helix transcriptional regulator [Streptomyces sp. NPDC048551]|uniref:helix-turn-helix transcriptional regulator n=1 Tax=Streptomyces sp. NPDC048551 TaxID=3155758 RepID=UPI00343C745E
MSQTQVALESGANIEAVRLAEQGLAREIAEPIMEWVEFLGLDSVELGRRYQQWRASTLRGAPALLELIFVGRHKRVALKRLEREPPGVVFRSYRQRAGISAAQVVRALGVRPESYRMWEAGKNSPTVNRALAVTGWTGAAEFSSTASKDAADDDFYGPVPKARRVGPSPRARRVDNYCSLAPKDEPVDSSPRLQSRRAEDFYRTPKVRPPEVVDPPASKDEPADFNPRIQDSFGFYRAVKALHAEVVDPPSPKDQPARRQHPVDVHCSRHNVRAHPGVTPVVSCQPEGRYRAVNEDGPVMGNVTACAITAANDAHFAALYTGGTFYVGRL